MRTDEDAPDHGDARCAALWARLDTLDGAAFRAQIDALAAERGAGDALGNCERASARDSTGFPALAVPLYRAALAAGLNGLRCR
ncbi:MAG: tetratricopeptide repeat protein [Burkholderiaceae bacterium]